MLITSNHMPVLRSILAPEALVSHVEAAYGLTITRVQLIKAILLDTYRLWTNQGFYILRIYPNQRRTLSEIQAELDFVTYLHSQGAPVSIPVLQRAGERLLILQAPEGTRYAVLFTYAHGEPLEENLTAIQSYGYQLARIHALADNLPFSLDRPALDLANLLDNPLTYLAHFRERQSDWAFLQQVVDIIRPQILALPTTPPHYGYCHGDAGGNNAHVDADGQVTFFDFDFCGLGWRAYDIGVFLNHESVAVTEAFLRGYQEVRALTAEEQAAIPLFQMAQTIWMLGLRARYINEWGEMYFTDRFIDYVLKEIKTTFESVQAR
ncbi:MAG: phosphotransferase [Caldilineaceae bacterium]